MIPILKVRDNDGNVQTISVVAAPSVYAPHGASHSKGGTDYISPEAIDAARKNHTHTADEVGAAEKNHTHTADEVSGVVNISNHHLWAKCRYVEVLGAERSGTNVISGYSTTEILVSDAISVNPHTGEISLVNAETVLFPDLNGKAQGKYVVLAVHVVNGVVDKWQVDNNNVLIKVPADATLSKGSYGSNNWWDIDKYCTVNYALEVVGYVNDAEANAYPVDDDFLYAYMGRIGGKTGFNVLSESDVLNTLSEVTR